MRMTTTLKGALQLGFLCGFTLLTMQVLGCSGSTSSAPDAAMDTLVINHPVDTALVDVQRHLDTLVVVRDADTARIWWNINADLNHDGAADAGLVVTATAHFPGDSVAVRWLNAGAWERMSVSKIPKSGGTVFTFAMAVSGKYDLAIDFTHGDSLVRLVASDSFPMLKQVQIDAVNNSSSSAGSSSSSSARYVALTTGYWVGGYDKGDTAVTLEVDLAAGSQLTQTEMRVWAAGCTKVAYMGAWQQDSLTLKLTYSSKADYADCATGLLERSVTIAASAVIPVQFLDDLATDIRVQWADANDWVAMEKQ